MTKIKYEITDRLSKAFTFAMHAHDSIEQKRKYDGQPYWTHPIRVALATIPVALHEDEVIAAVLHDVLEDVAPFNTDYDAEVIRSEFGAGVLNLVKEVSCVSKPSDGNRAARKLLDRYHYAAGSPIAQTIKLLDFMDNAFDIVENDPSFADVFLQEKSALIIALVKADPLVRKLAINTVYAAKEKLGRKLDA